MSILLGTAALVLLTFRSVPAQSFDEHVAPPERHKVAINQSKLITLGREVARVSKGQPDIANVVLLRPNQVLVQGRQVGTTNILLWDQASSVAVVLDIEITHDLVTLKEKLFELMPGDRIEVRSSNGSIVLSGQVSSLNNMRAALELAESFMPKSGLDSVQDQGDEDSPVINLMHVGGAQQVMLEVKVAEVSRALLRRMNINFQAVNPTSEWTVGAFNGGATFEDFFDQDGLRRLLSGRGNPVGPALDVLEPAAASVPGAGLFAHLVSDTLLFNATIDAGKDNGLFQILAEPTLTAMTGQEASFLSGGEFPIPIPQSGATGGITVEFKEFGIGVKFLPVVLGSGRINLQMNISVSELSNSASVIVGSGTTSSQFFVPSLSLRKATSALELSADQTMSIAGLISDNLRENIEKFPWLGDIPGLGALFRSQNFQQNQSELVIFVTPRLAKPIRPDQIRLPTDSFVPPSDVEFYLMGRLEGREAPPAARNVTEAAAAEPATSDDPSDHRIADTMGGSEGQFGHSLVEGD